MSRYHQLYNTTGAAKYTTTATSAVSSRVGPITGKRVTIFTGAVPHFLEFGTSSVVATVSSAVAPANSMIDYHFESGQYVAVLASTGTSIVTVLDSD